MSLCHLTHNLQQSLSAQCLEAPHGTTRPTSHQAKHPKTSDPAENHAKYKIKRKRGRGWKFLTKEGPWRNCPILSGAAAGRVEQMQMGISMAGPHAPCATRPFCSLAAPARPPCPALPASWAARWAAVQGEEWSPRAPARS